MTVDCIPKISRSILPLWVLLWVCLSGCGEGPEDRSQATVRDSAEVTIVENPAGAAVRASRWRLSRVPILDIGAVSGPEAERFHRVSDIARLPDGRIAVANSGSSEIRVFGPDGDHIRSFGRHGEGPGEFAGWLHLDRLPGDTLRVWDTGLRRFSVFTAAGGFVRSVRPDVQRPGLSFRGVLRDGTPLFSEVSIEQPGAVVRRSRTRVYRLDRSGQTVDSTGWYPFAEHVRTEDREYASPIYSPRTLIAVSEDGFWVGPADAYEIRFHGPSTHLRRIVRWEGPDRTVTEEHREAWIRARTRGEEGEERRRARRRAQEEPLAEKRAAYTDLIVDGSGNLWAQGFTDPGEDGPVPWTVFDADGRMIARVLMPRGLREHEIGGDYVLGTWRDEMDVVHVRLYELRKPR